MGRCQSSENCAEHRVAAGRLGECARIRQERRHSRLAACGVVAVDQRAERVERDVLRESHSQRELPGADGHPRPGLVERKPEQRPVQGMDREPGGSPVLAARHALAEHGDVGVVAAKNALVEWLERGPRECGDRAGGRGSCAAGHRDIITAAARRPASKVL